MIIKQFLSCLIADSLWFHFGQLMVQVTLSRIKTKVIESPTVTKNIETIIGELIIASTIEFLIPNLT